jgi:hypothetical protein
MKECLLRQQLRAFFSSPRNVIRVLAVALLAAGTYGYLTRQAGTGAARTYEVALTFGARAGQSTVHAQLPAGKRFKAQVDDSGSLSTASFLLTAEGADSVKLDGTVECGNTPAVHPVLVARLGQAATVRAAPGCELSVIVAEARTPAGN